MAGYGSERPLDTASNPARAGLPGIQPGDPTAGVGGVLIDKMLGMPKLPSLGQSFQQGGAEGGMAGLEGAEPLAVVV